MHLFYSVFSLLKIFDPTNTYKTHILLMEHFWIHSRVHVCGYRFLLMFIIKAVPLCSWVERLSSKWKVVSPSVVRKPWRDILVTTYNLFVIA